MAQNNIPVKEIYDSMLQKANKKFCTFRDFPQHSNNIWHEFHFEKVEKAYSKLKEFLIANERELYIAGLERGEMRECLSRFAQSAYMLYVRTSKVGYLSTSCRWFETILRSDYLKEGSSSWNLNVALEQLNCVSTFLTACLVWNQRKNIHELVDKFETLVKECVQKFQDVDLREWKQAIQDIHRFLEFDTEFMNIRTLRFILFFDTDPTYLPFPKRRFLLLQDAILSSYHHNEVKFLDLSLDTFRMLQCLELEPTGLSNVSSWFQDVKLDQSGAQTSKPKFVNSSLLYDIDPYLPPNPRKSVINHPAVTYFISVLATKCEDLSPGGVLLIYLSASGKHGQIIPLPSSSGTYKNTINSSVGNFETRGMVSDAHCTSPSSTQRDIPTGCLWMGSCANGGLNYLYPSDLIPFTRKPLFLIIDSDSSQAFKAIHGAERVEPASILLSPSFLSPVIGASVDSSCHQGGSQFTMFLTAPLQALCSLVGLTGSNVKKDDYERAEKSLSTSFHDWGLTLAASNTLDPVWDQVLADPFLRRLLLRFIFCQAVISFYAPTFKKKEFLPSSLPLLPEITTSRTAVMEIANIFGVVKYFIFS